jgi:hypothetical protein
MIECALTLSGVVLPSLLIALAVRRWFERVPWRIVWLLLALALGFIARGVFTRDMPVPLDEVVRGYPYRGLFGEVQAKNDLTNDTTKQILPWMQTAREELFHGRAPLWNSYLFCATRSSATANRPPSRRSFSRPSSCRSRSSSSRWRV